MTDLAQRSPFRPDIQALRGLAVLLVVLQHAQVSYLPGGFLGVDIFFAISGFLITGLVADAAEAGRFRFLDFYERRARRLLPAAYTTIGLTALAAPFFLDGFEYTKFVEQVVGSFTFSVNFVLWRQVDYFDSGANLKPLLHMWSLAVEEQYYLVLPMALLLCPRRLRLAAAAVLTLGSLALCLLFLPKSPSAVFYFLPFRAWELGIGSVAALLVRGRFTWPGSMWVSRAMRLVCATVLLALPFVASEQGHPGWAAAIVCLATSVLLVTGEASANERAAAAPLRPWIWCGDRSYSLYLVHWPIFALANNVFLGAVPMSVRLGLLVACFGVAELQYRLVERPMRKGRVTKLGLALLVAFPLLVIGLSVAWSKTVPATILEDRGWNQGFSAACSLRDTYVRKPECETGARPDILVWGDSYAMHLVDGVASTAKTGVVQATRTACGPFLDLAPLNGTLYSRDWAEGCIAFNRSVFDAVVRRQEVTTVVLSSALAQYVPGGEEGDWRMARIQDGQHVVAPQDREALFEHLELTVRSLRANGKRVVLIAPPPSTDFNIGRCWDRRGGHRWTVGAQEGCLIERAVYQRERSEVLAFLAEVERRGIVPVLRFDAVLCDATFCQTQVDGRSLYFDKGHLTRFGSRAIGQRMNLARRIEDIAR